MKKYYLLRLSSDPNIIGVHNGGIQAEIIKSEFLNKNNYDHLIKILGSKEYWKHAYKLSEISITLERVELIAGAILTDALHFGPVLINCPFLISERLKDIFSQAVNFRDFKFFETSLFNGDEKYPYYLMHFERLNDQKIDFEKSIFYTGDDLLGKQEKKFSSAEDMQTYTRTNVDLEIDTLFIKADDSFNPDLFSLGSGELVISQSLKSQLDDIGVTGLVMLPAYGDDRMWPAIKLVG